MNQPTNPFAASIARRQAAEQTRRTPETAHAAAAVADTVAPTVATAVDTPPTAPPPAATTTPTAEAPAVAAQAAPKEYSKSIHIITSTGDSRFDSILVGTVGSLDDASCFQIDRDYQQVSYLFTLTAGSMLPAIQPGQETSTTEEGEIVARQGERTIEITMPSEAAAALKVNLIAMCATRWDNFYEQQARGLTPGSVNANMLNAERLTVGRNVESYVKDKALQAWDVPVIYSVTVGEEDPSLRARDEAGLLKMAGDRFSRLMPDVTRMPTLHVAEGNGTVEEGTAADSVPLPQAWAAHVGSLDLTVEGSMPILAASASDAAKLTTALLMTAAAAPILATSFKPTAKSIQAAALLEPTPPDSDDDDVYYRDR